MYISKEQIDFFETFGFLKFPQIFADRIDWIIEQFTLTFPDHNTEHDGSKRTCIFPFIDQRMCTLLDDPRIETIASALLGEDFNYTGSDGNYYTGETKWHRDGFHAKYKYIKMAFYLDPLDGNSGALRVIPGSHHLDDRFGKDLDAKMRNCDTIWGINGEQVPAYVLDVTPGDLLVFNHNIYHSSWNGSTERRMFTMNLCQRFEEEDLPLLRNSINGHARFWIDRLYSEEMMNTATPQRMKHLQQVMENDYELAALSAQARLTMSEPSRG